MSLFSFIKLLILLIVFTNLIFSALNTSQNTHTICAKFQNSIKRRQNIFNNKSNEGGRQKHYTVIWHFSLLYFMVIMLPYTRKESVLKKLERKSREKYTTQLFLKLYTVLLHWVLYILWANLPFRKIWQTLQNNSINILLLNNLFKPTNILRH